MGNLFKPKVPEPQEPVRMPDQDDPALIEARRKRSQELMARGGRASTILSGTKLGGAG